MRFLVVEDDEILRETVSRSLTLCGHRIDQAGSIDIAEHLWSEQPFDAVLLDLNLPSSYRPSSALGSGLALLATMRKRGDRTPVLVLTARNRTDERIAGLEAGADDYLGKPFDLAEVEARLRALVRRASGGQQTIQIGQLLVDRQAGRCFVGSEALELPVREYEVLVELASKPGHVVSKRTLGAKLSDFDDTLGDNALETFISRLRKKLAGSGARIRTLRGLGYSLEAEPEIHG